MRKRMLLLVAAGSLSTASGLTATGLALAAASPTVITTGAGAVADTSVVLTGTVIPNGAPTTYAFQYGTVATLGAQGPTASAGAGGKAIAVKSAIGGLTPGTTYYYRIEATNAAGTATGAIKTFRTTGSLPPQATTGPAQGINTNSATLTGSIVPESAPTTYYFRYGPSAAYGFQTTPAELPPGAAPVNVTAQLLALEPGITFHYQLVATHGTVAAATGQDATFETFPFPRPKPKVAASTSPRHRRSGPFVFRTLGHVVNPSTNPPSVVCTGVALIRFTEGRTTVAHATVPLTPTCTFSGGVRIRHVPGRGPAGRTVQLRVVVRFSGNPWLAPASSPTQLITLG